MSDLNRWSKFWGRLGLAGDCKSQYTDIIVRNYFHKDRHYHNLAHISSCLEDFEQAIHLPNNPKAVESAIWFHDIIYNPRRQDNEEKSAGISYGFLIVNGLPKELAERVYDLIIATKHKDPPKNIDEKILTDIDLAILGKSEKEFDEYELNIRKEYFWYSDAEFKAGRSLILSRFLDKEKRPFIYSTDLFRNKYELQARKNLEKSLKSLSQ